LFAGKAIKTSGRKISYRCRPNRTRERGGPRNRQCALRLCLRRRTAFDGQIGRRIARL